MIEIFYQALVDSAVEMGLSKLRMNKHSIAAGLRRAIQVREQRRNENERDQRRKTYAALTEDQCLEKFMGQLSPQAIQERVLRRKFPGVLKGLKGWSPEEKASVSLNDVRQEAEVERKRILREVQNDLPVNFDTETIEQIILEEFDRRYGAGPESQESP